MKKQSDKKYNKASDYFTNEQVLIEEELQNKFKAEAIDITLPGKKIKTGNLHPLNIVKNKIKSKYFTGSIINI